MSNLTLDGSTSFIGTEFIKLLATGSSNLATEEYVDDAIEQNGGGGGNVDLSNYYTQTETDNLLNNKLNVNNPQDITGNLRLDPTNGLSKIILNAVSPPNASDDFYCNGNSHINGTMRVSVLTSDGDVNAQGVNADTFNSNVITNDIVFKHNDVEYMRFNATNDTIDLSKELNLGSSTLKINSITTNGLNDMTFGIDTLGEFLRFNISDTTVRVPDNRSFLAQNIFTDIIKPVAFANDVVLNGGNSTNDAYEEYMRLDASDEKVNFSKNVDMNEDLIMKSTKVLYLDATSNLLRYITTRNDNGQDILELVNNKATNNQIRFTNNGSTSLIVDNSFVYTPRQIQGDNGLKVDFIDTRTANADFQFRRSGATAITLKADNEVQFSGYILVNNISTPENTDLALRRSDVEFIRLFKDGTTLEEAIICSKQLRANAQLRVNNLQINQFSSGVQYVDFRLEDIDSVMRIYVGNSTSANLQMTNAGISLNRETTISSVKTNKINSNGDNTLNIQQNGNSFISLLGSTLDRVQINRFLRVVDGGNSTQAQFVNNSNGNYMEFRLGNHINAYASGTPVNGNTLHLNYYSHGNVMLGTNQDTGDDPIPTISINKFTSNTGNAFEVQGNSVFSGSVSTNTLNSESGDLTIQRDGTDVLNIFTYSPTNGPSIIVDAQSDCGISSSWLFANTFANRTGDTDTEFRGAISGGLSSGKVYMKYLHATETLDFDCVIDNTGRSVIGNILDTTVSDERLKTDIEDVDTDFTSCIKNVKVKTFKYKDDKYKTNDNYGFIAQELKEHLPKECKNIVKENKVKNEDETFLSINYMKLSVVLWKCCQEQQSKIEHLEASIYEMMEDIKELKGKKTTKPKAKAKSKAKVEK